MRRTLLAACALALLASSAHAACAPPPGPAPLETQPAQLLDPNWQARVSALDNVMARTDLTQVRTLFLGDSITEAWPPGIFDHFYGTRAALNLGVRGDATQGLLWRISRLPLGTQLHPKLVVLLIGTNNLWPNVSISNVVLGIETVVAELHRKLPNSKILLLNLLPRGAMPNDPARQQVLEVNKGLATCSQAAGAGVTLVDPGPVLLDGHGVLTKDIVFDGLHPSWLGYAMLGAVLEPTIRRELGD